MLKIKQVKNQMDMDRVIALDKKIFNLEGLDTFHSVWWLVLEGNTAVGFAGLVFKKGHVVMSRSGIFKRLQGKGVQRKLIKIRERYARIYGYTKVKSEVADWNAQSIANLIKCGYKISKLQKFKGEPCGFFTMTKELK